MDQNPPPHPWVEAMTRSDADLAAGRISSISVEELCREIEAEAQELEHQMQVKSQSSA